MQPLIAPFQASAASSRFFQLCAKILQPSSRRQQSSYKRARSRLRIKPDSSFLPSTTEAHDHIIYNPPPSMPNIYHTPSIFLPKNDRRRQIQAPVVAPDAQLTNPDQNTTTQTIAPPVREPYEKRYHLTEKDMAEMRALRREDPTKWTSSQLAKKFDCSRFFVACVVEGISTQSAEQQKQVTAAVKSHWGVKRRTAREDRALRKERWYGDQ